MSKQNKFARQGKRRPPFNVMKDEKVPVFVDHLQNARDCKAKTRGKTGIVYDERMTEHRCMWDSNYPECPERFTEVLTRCRDYGLIQRCLQIPSRNATSEELLKLHSPDRIELLQGTDGSPDAEALEALSSGYDSIYIHPSTAGLALLAAGSTIELVDAVLENKVQNGFALIRPPGHHATKSEFCGYCFYNNVAVAAQYALDNKGISRILIVDWDVHHGQATQQMFYDDPRVLYFSIHRYEQGAFWPNLRESDYHNTGHGEGKGFNVNIPLNQTRMNDADYMAIFHQVLLPMAYEFSPNLILISAGFDSALGDEKGEMELSPACYSHLTSSLMGLASGKVVAVLEGGYCLKSLAEGAASTLRTLLGDPCPPLKSLRQPCQSIKESILSAIYVLRPIWKCFQFQGEFKAPKTSADEVKHNQFLPSITFLGSDDKPISYPTRNCYALQNPETIELVNQQLDQMIKGMKLAVAPHRVCLIYDERMSRHRNVNEPNHPEQPARISAIYKLMVDFELVKRCHRLEAREATREELLMLHDENYLESLVAIPKMRQATLNQMQRQYGSVFLCPDSYEAALISAGSSLQIVESILSGESRSGIGIIRPPGHHAECDEAYGFCLLNNTALAAKYAIEIHKLDRILIVDWDVHHGNGIQRMFENDPRVLYISLHRLDIFPMKIDEADCNVVGTGQGVGYTVNIAWPKRGMGDAEYLAAFQQIILPIAYQFNPQLVLVAAGFDAAQGDPLGGCKITPEGYGQMTHLLSSLAQGRVAVLLEGGYNLSSISYSMMMCAKALLGDPIPAPLIKPLNSAAVTTIKRVINIHRCHWSALDFLVDLPDADVLFRNRVSPDVEQVEVNVASVEDQLDQLQLPDEEQKAEQVEANVASIGDQLDQLQLTDEDQKAGQLDSSDGLSEASGWTETPNEPKTLQEFLLLPENVQAMNDGNLFTVVPLAWCPHLELIRSDPGTEWTSKSPCSVCHDLSENWVCLTCYEVNCGRYIGGHMRNHNEESGHMMTLSFSDLSVWCYACESYVDHTAFYDAKNRLHLEKFGETMPKVTQIVELL